MSNEHATCSGCKRSLPRDRFHRDSTRPNGLMLRCKECRAAKWGDDGGHTRRALEVGGETLLSFGSPIEQECARALLQTGSVAKAASALNLSPNMLRAHLSEMRRRASLRGYSPSHDMKKTVPDGYHVKGVSTLYDGAGKVRAQWVKSKSDEQDRMVQIIDAVTAASSAWRGLAEPVTRPDPLPDDLLAVYPMGDPHLGMHAWAEETGQNFDLRIAEQNLCGAVDHLVSLAPRCKRALIIELGDFFHADNTQNRTMRSGAALDVDGRWAKVLRVGVRVMRRNIDRALEKHEEVTVWILIGNHDDHSSIFLALALSQFYENEPRVKIETSPAKFLWYRFGTVLIGGTHGDTVKHDDLPGVMAHDRAKDWGETEYRYWYCGHVHHDSLKEFPGVTVETFRTLAARDAWHAAQGYRSQRDMKLDVLHREHGRMQRYIVDIKQLSATR